MPHRLPPITALRALEAAARHLNFTKAAEELNVTQSAISHQIRTLEDLWHLKLFERRSRGLTLTRNGEALAPVVRQFMARMNDTLDELRVQAERDPLRVDMLQSFAVKWLVPRLGKFQERFPELDVWISTHDTLVDFERDDVDLAIRLGNGHYPGLYSRLLIREDVFPVCTPEFLAAEGEPRSPRDLLRYPLLLRLGEPAHPNWEQWFEATGTTDVSISEGPRFPDTNMALQAALDGQGIALARTAHVVDELAEGRLVRLFEIDCPSTVAYYLVCPEGHEQRAKVAAFCKWILEEAAEIHGASRHAPIDS
jgi:LysR family glycine cleavage system transcriptional activator